MLAKIAKCIKINKTKSTRNNELQAAPDNDTKATPAGESWIYVLLFCYHSFVFMLQSELSSNAQRFYKCIYAQFSCLCLTIASPKSSAQCFMCRTPTCFNVSKLENHLREVQRCSRQCAMCHMHNYDALLSPFYLVSSFGYFPFWDIAMSYYSSFSQQHPKNSRRFGGGFFLGIFSCVWW